MSALGAASNFAVIRRQMQDDFSLADGESLVGIAKVAFPSGSHL